jgi:hypothetical protein
MKWVVNPMESGSETPEGCWVDWCGNFCGLQLCPHDYCDYHYCLIHLYENPSSTK